MGKYKLRGRETVNECGTEEITAFFCDKQELKIARHWFTWHKDERLVREIEDLPKCSKPRTKKIASFRNEGNLKHNLIVWDTGVGKVVPIKRPFFG